jgi:hypothetical protein
VYITDGDVPCKPHNNNPDTWFGKKNSTPEQLAKKLCGLCPERDDCLASTLRFERRTGSVQPCVLGGMTASERAQLLRREAKAAARATA